MPFFSSPSATPPISCHSLIEINFGWKDGISPKNSIIAHTAPVLQATKFQEFVTNSWVIYPTPNFFSSDILVCPEEIILCDHSNKTPLAGLLQIISSFFCILFISMIWNLSCFLLFLFKLWQSLLQRVTHGKEGNALKFYFFMTCMCVLSYKKASKHCFCVTYQNTILYCIVPFSCAINCDGYVNICDNKQNETLVMVFFHSNTRCDLLFQESIIFFTSYQVTVNLLICSVNQSLEKRKRITQETRQVFFSGFKKSCLWAVTGTF